jgi:hypothetical protein
MMSAMHLLRCVALAFYPGALHLALSTDEPFQVRCTWFPPQVQRTREVHRT